MAQPDFAALSQHLLGAAAEIALVPNLPVFDINQQLDQINQQLQLLTGQVGALTDQVAGLAAQMAQFGAAQDLLPMRLQNASSPVNEPLRYPPGFAMVAQVPVFKQDLLSMNAAACQVTVQELGLPQLPGNPTIAQRRQQIIDYLGAALTA